MRRIHAANVMPFETNASSCEIINMAKYAEISGIHETVKHIQSVPVLYTDPCPLDLRLQLALPLLTDSTSLIISDAL